MIDHPVALVFGISIITGVFVGLFVWGAGLIGLREMTKIYVYVALLIAIVVVGSMLISYGTGGFS